MSDLGHEYRAKTDARDIVSFFIIVALFSWIANCFGPYFY